MILTLTSVATVAYIVDGTLMGAPVRAEVRASTPSEAIGMVRRETAGLFVVATVYVAPTTAKNDNAA